MVTRISINMLCALSKRVSEPVPAKNFGLKYFEKGVLKFSGPQPRRTVLGLSTHPLNPSSHAQKRVSVVGDLNDKSVTLLKYPEFLTSWEPLKNNEKTTKRTAKPIK